MKRLSYRKNKRRMIGVVLGLAIALVSAVVFAGTTGLANFVPLKVGSSHGDCTFTNDHSQIQCKIGDLKPGERAEVKLVVIPSSEGMMRDCATAMGRETDRDTGNNTDCASTSVERPEEDNLVNISLTKTGFPDPAKVGKPLTYSIVVTNSGPARATGVKLSDFLPFDLQVNSIQSSQGDCDVSNQQIKCELGAISNGGQATVTIVATPLKSGLITNQACAYPKETDSDYGRNCGSTTTIVHGSDIDIQVIKKGDAFGEVGKPVTYTIEVINNGPDTATDVELKDTVQ